MIWRRFYHLNFFSGSPLNYENLKKRLSKFRRWENHTPEAIRDYISANRKLQVINRQNNSTFKLNKAEGLNLDLKLNVTSKQLESELWQFLQENWQQSVADESIVKEYVLSSQSVDISLAFELVTKNYTHNLSKGKIVHSPVLALVHVLLHRNDYHGCFKVIDVTFNSERLQALTKQRFQESFLMGTLASFLVGFLQYLITPQLPLLPILLLDFGAIFGTMYGFQRINNCELLGRVSWRPHTSLFHRFVHQNEILVINKIVTYFEEYNEVNVKNYHISRVRNVSSLGTFHQNDYEWQLPETASLNWDKMGSDERVESLARLFRSELTKRRMLWNPLKEEHLFIDFWVSHGENFEWVEPDQDPAEMVHFRDRDVGK